MRKADLTTRQQGIILLFNTIDMACIPPVAGGSAKVAMMVGVVADTLLMRGRLAKAMWDRKCTGGGYGGSGWATRGEGDECQNKTCCHSILCLALRLLVLWTNTLEKSIDHRYLSRADIFPFLSA